MFPYTCQVVLQVNNWYVALKLNASALLVDFYTVWVGFYISFAKFRLMEHAHTPSPKVYVCVLLLFRVE